MKKLHITNLRKGDAVTIFNHGIGDLIHTTTITDDRGHLVVWIPSKVMHVTVAILGLRIVASSIELVLHHTLTHYDFMRVEEMCYSDTPDIHPEIAKLAALLDG